MTEPVAVVPIEPVRVDLGVIRADKPAELVRFATEAANALAGVIDSRKLYSTIQGKRFVRCEGWTTLAAMLGVTPHEISVTELDGAFTATVELRRLTDGQPVSRASAECGPDESTWKGRARYARRSMALTRATAKACRLAFSWIMALSGYEVTPAEEIPQQDEALRKPKREPMTEKPAPLAVPEPPMPWERPDNVSPDGEITGPTRDTPCPFVPSKRAVKDLAKNQLAFLEEFLTASKEDEAAVWLPLVIAERAARSKTT